MLPKLELLCTNRAFDKERKGNEKKEGKNKTKHGIPLLLQSLHGSRVTDESRALTAPLLRVGTRLSRGGLYKSRSGAGTLVAASTLRGGVSYHTPPNGSDVVCSCRGGVRCDQPLKNPRVKTKQTYRAAGVISAQSASRITAH